MNPDNSADHDNPADLSHYFITKDAKFVKKETRQRFLFDLNLL